MTVAENVSARTGTSGKILLHAIFKLLVELMAGRGGLDFVCQVLGEVDFIEDLKTLRPKMEENLLFFNEALNLCAKEMLKRPLGIRENECLDELGSVCVKCGFCTSLWASSDTDDKCPECGSEMENLYAMTLDSLVERKMGLGPETVLMDVAYDRLAEAYVNAFRSIRLILAETAGLFRWDRFRINDPEIRNYIDSYRWRIMIGERHIPREEKQVMQMLVRANLAGLSGEEVEKAIRLGVAVAKYGWLSESLHASGARMMHRQVSLDYSVCRDSLNTRIRGFNAGLFDVEKERKPRVDLASVHGGRFSPCVLLPSSNWEGGQVGNGVTVQALYDLPIFSHANFGAVNIALSRLGGGKTLLLSSLLSYAVLEKSQVVFSPLNDKSNSFSLACMPFWVYSRRTKILRRSFEVLQCQPQALPTLTLTFMFPNEEIRDVEANPPTVFDRKVVITDPYEFSVDFQHLIAEELAAISEEMGFKKPCGVVNVRNLDRLNQASKTNVDIQVCANLLHQFSVWRTGHLSDSVSVVLDELSYVAPSSLGGLYASDAQTSGSALSDFIKECRQKKMSVCGSTQLPVEIIPDIRNAWTNVFWRELATSKDKGRSQIDFLLDSLQLEDPSVKLVARDLNNRGGLPENFWFWWNQQSKRVEVVRPNPPSFCIIDRDTSHTLRALYRKFEKDSGQKVLLDCWEDVPVLGSCAGGFDFAPSAGTPSR